MQRKPSVLTCPRCSLVNAIDNKYCSKCSYPLVPSAFGNPITDENKVREVADRFRSKYSAENIARYYSKLDAVVEFSLK
jgi:integrase/recombinase XerD